MTRYPHESPILAGMLIVILGILIMVWRVFNPWIPDCPEVAFNGIYTLCDDYDIVKLISCIFGVTGICLIITDIMETPE